MPNDAKLGLVVGVGLVIAVAVVFFRKESPAADPAGAQPAPAVTPSPPPAVSRAAVGGRSHTVREGETLFDLAQRYYGDGNKSRAIYQINRNRLDSPDELTPGTVLLIPDLPQE